MAKQDTHSTWDAMAKRLTRQGVRDLGGNGYHQQFTVPRICDHQRIDWCCAPKRCGHLVCRDCGLVWDEGAQR